MAAAAEIPHNRPQVTETDRARVDAVLRSGWLAQGSEVGRLERAFVDHLGADGAACAVSSGTAALFLALRGLGIGAGDCVALPTYACSALLNAVHMLGARALPVDVREDDFNIDPASVERLAREATTVIAVHSYGATAPIEALGRAGRRVIEDCCQSLGGPQGRQGDAAVFSFYATKIVTGGQGGLVYDRKRTVAEAARDYREFDGREDYKPRFNLQTTDINAALVASQLERLEAIRARRRNLRLLYRSASGGLLTAGWRLQGGLDSADHLPYRYVLVAPDRSQRNRLREHMREAGIRTIVPIERFELLHRYLERDPSEFGVAERLADTTLSLPLYPALTDAEVDRVCQSLREFS